MRKSIKISKFTLVELLMAMAVFTIIAMIMMRFFSSAQQVWSKASQRNELYADARIAMDLIARDLQCALYNNDILPATTTRGIYPFWFQKIKTVDNTATAPKYYFDNSIEWTTLNFITATSIKPDGAASSVCEIRYTFVPMWEEFYNNAAEAALDNTAEKKAVTKLDRGGWLFRSCTGDDKIASGEYNFDLFPATSAGVDRLNKIWINKNSAAMDLPTIGGSGAWTPAADISFAPFQKVIPHVYNLKFTCYYYYPGNNAYDNSVSYSKGDWVGSAGDLYLSLIDNNIGNTPPALGKWLHVIDFNPSITYPIFPEKNTIVSYLGKIYISKQNIPAGYAPDANPDYWQLYLCAFAPKKNSDQWGSYFPVAVKIELFLMSNSDWTKWQQAITDGNQALATKIRKDGVRSFSKIVNLNNKLSL